NVQRFSGSLEGHSGSMFYYVLMIPALLLPWLAWLVAAVRQLPADWKLPERRFLWIWFLFVTVFFSLSGTKLPHYALYGCTPLFALLAIHRERVKSIWLGVAPAFVLIIAFIALPGLLQHAASAGWIKDAYYLAQVTRVPAASSLTYILGCALVLCAALALAFRQREVWSRVLTIAILQTLLIALAVSPLLGEVLQGPVKRAGIAARAFNEPGVLWNFHAPSFSIYRGQVTPTEQARPGQIALTRIDRLPADAKVDVLYKEGGVVLVRMK
ncbi:MAG: glycosyltransferase, partial [Proteobacteria bacterium]|nr:glycosyltransferase [Pseudomonadota bacterium]